ncbi:MAG: cysteine rich repeat-containing protein [Hyphomicrobiaceae bacterium]|nr:hypothetical protein [Hyphomicrobiaceae bacterium]
MSLMGFDSSARGQIAGALLGLGALLVSGAAHAAPGQGGAMSACRADVQTFCGGIEAGGGKKMRCLIENQSKLSADCGAAVKQRVETRAQRLGGVDVAQAAGSVPAQAPGAAATAAPGNAPNVVAPKAADKGGKGRMAACRTDVATFCATTEKGAGGRMKCLADNKAKLSPDCAAAVDGMQSAKQAKKTVCATEAETLCGTAKGPARRQCLETNKAKLSADCATALDKRAAKRAEKADVGGGKQPTGGMMQSPAQTTPPKQ